jgi:hypothetical protein
MAVCCQNLPLGALSSRSAPSVLVGVLFKKFGLFFEHVEIQENAIRVVRAITESAFQEAFQQWKKSWERCIASSGGYFEGDSCRFNVVSYK